MRLSQLLIAVVLVAVGCPRSNDVDDPDPPNGTDEEVGFELRRGGDWSHVGEASYERAGISPHCDPSGVDSGPERSGPVEVLWETPLYGELKPDMTTSVIAGRYFALSAGEENLYELDASTGAFNETFKTRKRFQRIGADGFLYLWQPALRTVDPMSGWVHRWLHIDGRGGYVVPPMALSDGRLLVQDYFGYVSLRIPDGVGYEVVWERWYGDPIQKEMVLDLEAGRLIFAVLSREPRGTHLLAVNIDDGEIVWDYPGSAIDAPMLLDSEHIVVYSTSTETGNREVRILSRETGEVLRSVVAEPARTGTHSYGIGSRLAASDSGDRIYLVQHRLESDHDPACCVAELTAYDVDLDVLWRRRFPWPPSTNSLGTALAHGMIQTRPVVAPDGTIYLSSHNCHVYALNPDGDVIWWDRLPFPGGARPVLLEDGTLIAVGYHLGEDLLDTDTPRTRASIVRAYRRVDDWDGEAPCVESADPACPIVMDP